MKLKRLAVVLGLVVFGATAFTVHRYTTAVRSAIGVQSAQGADLRTAGSQQTPIRTASDAEAALEGTDSGFQADVGLSATDLPQTHAIYTFDPALNNFAGGQSVFETPLSHGGYCLTFSGAISCTHTLPSTAEPLIGVGYDPDFERSGEPFVLVSIREPTVRAVSYLCSGTSYPAEISGNVVAFISPSSSLSVEDCSEVVTFANGRELSKHV